MNQSSPSAAAKKSPSATGMITQDVSDTAVDCAREPNIQLFSTLAIHTNPNYSAIPRSLNLNLVSNESQSSSPLSLCPTLNKVQSKPKVQSMMHRTSPPPFWKAARQICMYGSQSDPISTSQRTYSPVLHPRQLTHDNPWLGDTARDGFVGQDRSAIDV